MKHKLTHLSLSWLIVAAVAVSLVLMALILLHAGPFHQSTHQPLAWYVKRAPLWWTR